MWLVAYSKEWNTQRRIYQCRDCSYRSRAGAEVSEDDIQNGRQTIKDLPGDSSGVSPKTEAVGFLLQRQTNRTGLEKTLSVYAIITA